MNLLDQPDELIIEELKYLPIHEILTSCRINSRIAKLCQSRELWYYRLMNDFQIIDVSRITEPRNYYYDLLEKRKDILDYILKDISPAYLNKYFKQFQDIDINTYGEFMQFQHAAVDKLTAREIENLIGLIELAPRSRLFEASNQVGPDLLTSFFFDSVGTIIFTSTEEW